MEVSTVAETYLFIDGHAITFDEGGFPVPELQGPRTAELAERIRAASTPATRWYGWGETGPLCWDQSAMAAFLVFSQG